MIGTQLQRQRVFIINPTLLQRYWCCQRESPSACETSNTLFEINLISWRERKVFIMSKLWSESWNVSKCWSAFREGRNGPWFSETFSSSCLHVHCSRTDAELEIKTLKKIQTPMRMKEDWEGEITVAFSGLTRIFFKATFSHSTIFLSALVCSEGVWLPSLSPSALLGTSCSAAPLQEFSAEIIQLNGTESRGLEGN